MRLSQAAAVRAGPHALAICMGFECAGGAAPSCGQIWEIMHQAAPASRCLHTTCKANDHHLPITKELIYAAKGAGKAFVVRCLHRGLLGAS